MVSETTPWDWHTWQRTSESLFRRGWRLGKCTWGISNSITYLYMDHWSEALVHMADGSRELFNPLQSGHLQQINWTIPYMSLHMTRMKSALRIQWCASSFFSAYILSGWLKVLPQCICSTNEPSLGFIVNQVNFHNSKFCNLAGKSLERKRIMKPLYLEYSVQIKELHS